MSRRFFADFKDNRGRPGSLVALAPDDAHHLTNVLRLRPGSPVTVVDRESHDEFEALVATVGEAATIQIIAPLRNVKPLSRVASLLFAITKGERNDWLCEKAVELGVRILVFWQAERSVVRLTSPAEAEKKKGRWRRIAESAAKQSGKNLVADIYAAESLDAALELVDGFRAPEDRLFCASLLPEAKELRDLPPPALGVHLLIGPEGDLTPAETSTLGKRGFELVSLGPYTLRSETAALAATAMIQGLWGWMPLPK